MLTSIDSINVMAARPKHCRIQLHWVVYKVVEEERISYISLSKRQQNGEGYSGYTAYRKGASHVFTLGLDAVFPFRDSA